MDGLTWALLIYVIGVPLMMGAIAALDDDPDAYIPAGFFWPAAIVFITAFAITKKLSNIVSKEP